MTVSISIRDVSGRIAERLPDAVLEAADDAIVISGGSLPDVAALLRDTPGLDFDYLAMVSGVDYYQYFEVVYRLISLQHNHALVIKARCPRENPVLPSVVGVWRAADHQEREIYDLLGITFDGHPNLRRIALWEGFEGHPLRKDYLT